MFRRTLPGDRYDLAAATEAQDHWPERRHSEQSGGWGRGLSDRRRHLDPRYRQRRGGDTTEAATALLSAAKADGVRAVDVYVAPVKLDGQHIRPANLREAIRLRGPTIELPFSFGI